MILARLRDETRTRHAAVEARIAGVADWSALGFDFDRRRKTALLDRDLADAGADRASWGGFRCTTLPDLTSVPEALGCLYVLEGATLGGRVITRHLRGLPDGPFPRAFFTGYGGDVGPMWKAFGAFLTGYAADHGGDDVIVRSACSTFDTLGAWLAAGEARP